MKIRRRAKDTLTAFELNRGETLEFSLRNGRVVLIELVSTSAKILSTTLKQLKVEESGGRTDFVFSCVLRIDGRECTLEREISTQKSFYEPWLLGDVLLWFDAVDDIFEFLTETHGPDRDTRCCRPCKHARFAIQDASLPICPESLHVWCPLPEGGLKIEDCYRGEDCWLGAYNGAAAHPGLDINHPKGTPLWAPLDIHDHFYFNSLEMGHNNNRWRGIHHWENGSEWILQAHHLASLIIPEHRPFKKGEQFALAAGVLPGVVDHSHFVFKIHDEGETVLLDPWILFWKMYKDLAAARK